MSCLLLQVNDFILFLTLYKVSGGNIVSFPSSVAGPPVAGGALAAGVVEVGRRSAARLGAAVYYLLRTSPRLLRFLGQHSATSYHPLWLCGAGRSRC